MKPIAIIPARYASTRFPGKPLVDIGGKPMIQHVYERCSKAFDLLVVATDDVRIEEAVKSFGGKVVMTAAGHPSGTDRCAEAARLLSADYDFDVVVNVQGDEPFIQPDQFRLLLQCFDDEACDIATLLCPIDKIETLFDHNKVKAVRSAAGFALYFSRHTIPFQRDAAKDEWLTKHQYFLHIGLYAYRASVLQALTQLEPSPLEQGEKLEQLRWLENDFRIKTALTDGAGSGIDTPEDLERLQAGLL